MLIDKDVLIKELHDTAFHNGDDREICYSVIERQSRAGYEVFEGDAIMKEAEYWRKKCQDYEHTILVLAIKLAEREGV